MYYIRAYATNSVGTAYGNEISFTTMEIVVPTLTTTAVTSIALTTAVSGGNITSDGGATVSERGVCWATTASPTIAGSKTSDGTGTGTFTSNLTGLLPSTTYYVRSYATNTAGTAYGTEVTFTTNAIVIPTVTTDEASAIALTTAVSGGNVTSDGGATVSERGICWATTVNPTTASSKIASGTGTGAFTGNLTGLTAGTTYYIRAYAINSVGTAYGNQVTFTTTPVAVPTLTTTAASAVLITTATSGGNITADGGGAVTARGVCWATTADPTIANSKTTNGTGTGSFTSNLTGLLPATTYHVRAYATNSAGTAYGLDVTFTTNPVGLATLTTVAATSITLSTAVSGGNITSDGGGSITERGVCWAVTANPTIANPKTSNGTGTGGFVSNITGLLPGTMYHVRAFATNSAGTAYGTEITFTTSAIVVPTLTTAAATSITLTTAVSGGSVTSDGGASITEKGVCWSTAANPTISDPNTSNGTGTAAFTSNITGLTAATTYHVRAYATNSAGTGYGPDITFTTSNVVLPTLTTTVPSAITLTAAASGGNITADGGGSITARGVCWSLSPNPTTSNSITTNGSGTGSFTSSITGLAEGTTYYVRAYATNSTGTGYGNQLIFSTNLSDIENNVYKTVLIGSQLWMAENLKTNRLNDNTVIPEVTLDASWIGLSTMAYCWYNNDDAANKDLYGAMYNWFAVNTGTLCPTGWHVPTDYEYGVMEATLGVPDIELNTIGWRGTTQGSQMKSTTGWDAGENGTNTSGFTALPGGYRYAVDGTFQGLGAIAYWWTSSLGDPVTTWYRRLNGNNTAVYRGAVDKTAGKSVRCIKD